MADVLVEVALKGLEAMGIPTTPSIPYFLNLLMDNGEDVLTAFPRIVHTIEQLGGNSWQVLEEVATGFEQYGPVAYVQRTIEHYFEPQVGKVQDIQRHKSILTAQHRATLKNIHNTIATLHPTDTSASLGGLAFTGGAADAMMAQLAELSTHFEKLMSVMDDSQQIDRDLQVDLQHVLDLVIGMVIFDLILFAVVFVIVFVGSQLILLIPEAVLAPESGGLSLVAGGGASLGGAAAIAGGSVTAFLPAEGIVILGALTYAFGRWAVRHAMLEIAPPAITHVYPMISAGPTLPNPDITTAEAELAKELFEEFGGAIPKETLQYLVKMLGTSELSEAMIRCLYQSGYLSIIWGGLDGKNRSVWNSITKNLDPNDLEGAWKEANPSQVDPSSITPGSRYISNGAHDDEVDNAATSIDNFVTILNVKIGAINNTISHASDPNAPKIIDLINLKARLQNLESAYAKLRDFVRSKIKSGSPSPNTWSDQGKLPIVEDLLQTSSCKIPAAKYYK